MGGIVFDSTISGGSVLNALAIVIGFVVAFTRIGGRLDLLSHRVETLESSLTDAKGIDKRLITLEERVTNHVAMMVEFQKEIAVSRQQLHQDLFQMRELLGQLRRGEGWITEHRSSVEGEYPGPKKR